MNPWRVPVACGSKAGGTARITRETGNTLQHDGFDAVVLPGGDFRSPERIRAWTHHIGTELDTTP
ncbi:hypothetical protein KV205_06010 [Streptomyces sp. SKN60]|uniref:hypothetical protein n=1 Tax=Streptomyces sp. SKN60 TaxID=2855506 RepID=UPI00224860E7|nr:hypothetical protein [Streptomyces sp. SKN60]MCX2180086.1 hypothetical protein [Streptomyces sp. SKN60]